jgi:hypothetical protein
MRRLYWQLDRRIADFVPVSHYCAILYRIAPIFGRIASIHQYQAASRGFFVAMPTAIAEVSAKTNRRLNLRVPRSIKEKVQGELRFLNWENQEILIEDHPIESAADFIRATVNAYIHRGLDQFPKEPISLDEPAANISFFMDQQSRGLWDTAIRHNLAISYNQLAESALFDYFARQDQIAIALEQRSQLYLSLIETGDFEGLREAIAA